jgi:hypothetical protein
MIILKLATVLQAQDAEGIGDGTTSWGQDGTNHENVNMVEDTLTKYWRKGGQDRYNRRRQVEHGRPFLADLVSSIA